MHELLIHRLDPGLPLPQTEYPGDAGLDLRARADVQIEPGQRVRIPTGIAIAMPPGVRGLNPSTQRHGH